MTALPTSSASRCPVRSAATPATTTSAIPTTWAAAGTWRSTTWQLGAVIGPALGGILNTLIGARGSYLVDAALIVVALAALGSIHFRALPTMPDLAEPILRSLAAGIRYLRQPWPLRWVA